MTSSSYGHPILGDKTYTMLGDMGDALALGIAHSSDVLSKLSNDKYRSAEEWEIVDKAFCLILDGYRGFLKNYVRDMAASPSYFRLGYGKNSDFKRMTGFIKMPDHLVKEFTADKDQNDFYQQQFTLHQIFNYMADHAKELNEPLSRKLPDAASYDPVMREARTDGIRYAVQYWQTVLGKVMERKSALDVASVYGLPQVVDEEPVFDEGIKTRVKQLKSRISGLSPSPFQS